MMDKTLYMKGYDTNGGNTRCYTPNVEEGYYYYLEETVDSNGTVSQECQIGIYNDSGLNPKYSDAHKTYIIQDCTVNTGTNFEYTYRPTSVKPLTHDSGGFRLRSTEFDTVAFIIALGHEFNIITDTFYAPDSKIRNAYVYFDRYVSVEEPYDICYASTIYFTVYMEYTQEEYKAGHGPQFPYKEDEDRYNWDGTGYVKFGQSLSTFKSEMAEKGFTF